MKNGTTEKNGKVAKKSKAASGATTVVVLSLPSIAAILALCTIAAFSLGRYLSAQGIIQFTLLAPEEPVVIVRPTPVLPDPPLFKNKQVPCTRYTSRLFDSEAPVRSSTALLNHDGSAEYVTDEHGNHMCDMNLTKHSQPTQEPLPHEDGVFQPAGQHLLVDIKNVEADFLDSEVRLATAMIDVITQSELTLLSYHCHGLIPEGVSCVGVLLESHVSFHTWPSDGVITLDLFTCGSKSLLPLVQVIYKLFGLPRQDGDAPEMVWNHKKRGFRYTDDADVVNGLSDFDRFLGDAELDKDAVFSTQTAMQKIDIYDSIEPRFRNYESHRRSLAKDGSYESQNPELFQKDRLFFIDGVLQSRRFGEAAYHEAMVHPAMITHQNPKRVVIVGGGEGAALREVLKHNTVEKVVMLEVDAELTAAAKTFLSAWNDCSSFIPGVESCFDDPRLEVHNVDAVDWFSDYFGEEHDQGLERFDIVIVDALDPSIETEETDRLFANENFVVSIYNSLGENGLLVAQLGESEAFDSVPDSYWNNGLLGDFFWSLEEAGFQGVSEYEEMHGRVAAPMRFVAAMKNRLSRTRWFGTEAEIGLRLQKRMMPAADGSLPLRLFDAASMMQYTYPHRAAEERFCKGNPSYCGTPQDVFRPGVSDHPITSFEVGPSTVGAGRGVFAKEDISAQDYLSLDECVNQMFVPPAANNILYKAQKQNRGIFWDTFVAGYLEGYGLQDNYFGDPSTTVDPGILTFVNHGCRGTYNIGSKTEGNEVTLELGHPATSVYDTRNEIYNPHIDRRYFPYDCTGMSALRDIQAGEEILDNYIMFGGGADQSDFDTNLKELKSMCAGSGGIVHGYEGEDES